MKKKVVLDCDGVCLDFDRGFGIVAADVLGRTLINTPYEYDLCKKYGITEDEQKHVWREMENHYSGWAGLPLMEDAVAGFNFFKDNGFEIHLVTGIEEHIAALRLANLKAHGMTADSIICVGHGTASKVKHIKEINPLVFVDDRLQHINEASFVPNRVWVDLGQNQFDFKPDDKTVRVVSMHEWTVKHGPAFLESLENPVQKTQVAKKLKLGMG